MQILNRFAVAARLQSVSCGTSFFPFFFFCCRVGLLIVNVNAFLFVLLIFSGVLVQDAGQYRPVNMQSMFGQ